ncbi:hypothetical protein C5167_025518 [Papaver somniferum]|uniref:Uncharacterized protein n=1 Tax=Papaver somniferum TaxID=3469 RepID=A0A4Y7JUQ5_PAPSO|nr:hypothetical protein C5167_025518 [Papaver somniferum]
MQLKVVVEMNHLIVQKLSMPNLMHNCGYGLSGILASLKGVSEVRFQDPNAETIKDDRNQ